MRLPSHTVIQRAESRLGEVEYGIFENNCEHFATWCVTGEANSAQVDRARNIAPFVVIAGPVGVAAAWVAMDVWDRFARK
jgi:hypothetical protein